MTEPAVIRRVNKVAVEFNISWQTVIEFLEGKGIAVENKPTGRVSEEAYEALLQKFQPDKVAKLKSESLNLTPLIHKEDKRKEKDEKVVAAESHKTETEAKIGRASC